MLEPLLRAMSLAEPEGHVRVFAAEGSRLRALLQQLARQQPASAYLRRLIEACVLQPATGETTPPSVPATARALLDPLSDRELDVLRLLGSDLDGPELARHLSVSLNTLRTHTKNIYAKLGVNSRRAAVRRASELNLVPGTHDRRACPRTLRHLLRLLEQRNVCLLAQGEGVEESPHRSPDLVMTAHQLRS